MFQKPDLYSTWISSAPYGSFIYIADWQLPYLKAASISLLEILVSTVMNFRITFDMLTYTLI